MSKNNMKDMDKLIERLNKLNSNAEKISKEKEIVIPKNATKKEIENILVEKLTK